MPRVYITMKECWNCGTIYDSEANDFCPKCLMTPDDEVALYDETNELMEENSDG